MSRIGKKPIVIPSGVTVNQSGGSVSVKGPKGTLSRTVHELVKIDVKDNEILVESTKDSRDANAFRGLTRALLANMVQGVFEGFKKEMSLVGVGYKVALEGKKLLFSLGYSHTVEFPLPQGIEAEIGERGVNFAIKGIDKQLVGQTCATIRSFRPPEPYKGKGIRYINEKVRQKAGKAGAK